MYKFIFVLKALAALLITNSHFDGLYPIPELSVGGSLGNTLFFLDTSVWSVEGALFFKYSYYFLVMLVGYQIRCSWENIADRTKKHRGIFALSMLLTFAGYLGVRLLTIWSAVFMQMQFLVQVMTLLFGVSCFCTFFGYENIIPTGKVSGAIEMIGKSSLEIYLINYIGVEMISGILFPWNVIGALVLIVTAGCAIHTGIVFVQRGVQNLILE